MARLYKGMMPVSYVIDKKNGFVLATATGVLTVEDILQFRRQIRNEPDFDPSLAQLGDLSAASIDLSADEIRILAETSVFSLTARRALVGESHEVYGLARMFSIVRGLRGDRAIRVFRRRDEALAWLLQKDQAA
ncbi:MAG TPA: hypothetical protein VKE93_00355 [Candidatus Angelobacter sp.]|nr:hypothetical protein [Candidatus Angelobacter sp.]